MKILNKNSLKRWLKPFFQSVNLIPKTYFSLLKIFSFKEGDKKFISGLADDGKAIVIPWYIKTSIMFSRYGRQGFYFEEALGMPFKGRFWFDSFSIKLLKYYSFRKIILISLVIIIIQFLLLSLFSEKIILSLVFIFLMIPSPLFTRSLIH